MTNIQKAVRAVITLGDIELDVFQLPDGSYKMSKAQACETVQLDRKRLSELLEKNSLKAIAGKGSTLSASVIKAKVDVGRGNITAELIPLEMATLIWLESGSEIGKSLAYACITESLETRADEAFGKVRSTEEKNQRLKARIQSKITRRTLTDSIKEYIARHPELSENYSRFIYSNCTDCLNLHVLGAKAKQVKLELDLKPTGSLRDTIPVEALRELESMETFVSRLIDVEDLEPLEACKKALVVFHAKTIGYQ